jgi:ATP-binding cassette subfamily B multidrug efflux pump
MEFLKKYMFKYWKLFFTAVFFLSIEAYCDLLQPTIMAGIVDNGVAAKKMNIVMSMGGKMLLVAAFGAFAATMRNIISSSVSQKFGAELRLDLFKKIQSFSFDNVDEFEGATLITRLTNDITQLQNFTNGLMRIFVKAPLLCIGSLIMATLLNPHLAVVLLVVVPVIICMIAASMNIGLPFFIKVQKSIDRVNGVMREYLSGIRVVKAFNRFDYEVNRFNTENENLAYVSTKAMKVMAIFSPGITLVVNLGIVVVLWIGGFRVESHSIHVGQIIAFINYMTQILSSLMMISFVFNMFVRARVSARRIGEVFSKENAMSSAVTSYIYKGAIEEKGRLDFENVFFKYKANDREPVIKNVSFTCMPGEVMGIIGSTGSGKSSLINLIPRFYDVTSGCIKVDGEDIRNIDIKKLRDNIAVVPQKIVLFTGTIMDNIRWGKEMAKEEEVARASTIAQAHDFITAFPEGYNTTLGQGGVNLSGGQKQRISIARALIKNPELLILDDSTSAVDVATETKLMGALKEYYKGLSCIIIAQRITSVMMADRIIVLDNGSISDIGSHEELLIKSTVYKDIYSSQIGKGVTEL